MRIGTGSHLQSRTMVIHKSGLAGGTSRGRGKYRSAVQQAFTSPSHPPILEPSNDHQLSGVLRGPDPMLSTDPLLSGTLDMEPLNLTAPTRILSSANTTADVDADLTALGEAACQEHKQKKQS